MSGGGMRMHRGNYHHRRKSWTKTARERDVLKASTFLRGSSSSVVENDDVVCRFKIRSIHYYLSFCCCFFIISSFIYRFSLNGIFQYQDTVQRRTGGFKKKENKKFYSLCAYQGELEWNYDCFLYLSGNEWPQMRPFILLLKHIHRETRSFIRRSHNGRQHSQKLLIRTNKYWCFVFNRIAAEISITAENWNYFDVSNRTNIFFMKWVIILFQEIKFSTFKIYIYRGLWIINELESIYCSALHERANCR